MSRQCDLMVLDAVTPPLWERENYRLVPVECCEAVIEVKSHLTVAELKKCWGAARAIKSLPRTAYLPNRNLWTSDPMPPQVHVFAYESASLATLGDAMNELANEGDYSGGLDSVCIFDKGFFSWVDLSTGNFGKRTSDSRVAAYESTPGSVLLFLLSYLNKRLIEAELRPKFDMDGYVSGSLGNLHGLWPEYPPDELRRALPGIVHQ